MKRIVFLALAALLVAEPAAAALFPNNIASAWEEYGPGGVVEVRAVLREAKFGCPFLITFKGQQPSYTPLTPRAATDANFPLVCSMPLPPGTRHAFLGFRDEANGAIIADAVDTKTGKMFGAELMTPLADVAAEPQRILVLGDTGCRIKGTYLQACNDPKQWPFAALAQAAADLKPDLILHLGDYLYRESPCPEGNAGCAGSPYGDNWKSWDADFFTPAAPLLGAAPWIVIRGNHEDCNRAGPGFLRLLGPIAYDPAVPCAAHLDPYLVHAGSQPIAIMDSASAADVPLDEASVPIYAKDFDALKTLASGVGGHELWMATHRPMFGVVTYMGAPAGGNATMIKAAGDLSAFKAISLLLAGHIHSFEAINYDAKMPPQIVAGHGGDNLDTTPPDLRGTTFQGDTGVHVKTGLSVPGFGFLMLTREKGNAGWTIQLYDSDGKPIKQCAYLERSVFCLGPR